MARRAQCQSGSRSDLYDPIVAVSLLAVCEWCSGRRHWRPSEFIQLNVRDGRYYSPASGPGQMHLNEIVKIEVG